MNSRAKGKRYELEVAEDLREHGFQARRDGRLNDDLQHNIPGVHLECKRAERLEILKWCRQAERDADGRVPVVVFRSSRERSRAVVPLEWLLDLLRWAGTVYEDAA